MKDRFEIFPDPLDNWIVWDREKDDIAEAGNQTLQFLTESQAGVLCSPEPSRNKIAPYLNESRRPPPIGGGQSYEVLLT